MAKNNKLRRVAEDQAKKSNLAKVNLTIRDAALLGVGEENKQETPYVNLKYYAPKHQCFSDWPSEKLKAFSEFCVKMTQSKWASIYQTGGSAGHKTGLGYTVHKNTDVLPKHPGLAALSPDLTWFELRISGESRVHGFRIADAFFLVFLDHKHEVYKS